MGTDGWPVSAVRGMGLLTWTATAPPLSPPIKSRDPLLSPWISSIMMGTKESHKGCWRRPVPDIIVLPKPRNR